MSPSRQSLTRDLTNIINGFNDQRIGERVTSVEKGLESVKSEIVIRWDNHDKNSESRFVYIKDKLEKLCGQPEKCREENRKFTYKAVGWALGIPGVLATIIGLLILLFRK